MLLEIVCKLISESLLSLYPIFVKFIDLPIITQMWSRFFTHTFISGFFVDWGFIKNNILTKYSILLIIITIIHIYTTYRGFLLLDSGIAYVIFYTYPIMIILLSHRKLFPSMILTLIGVYLLSKKNDKKTDDKDNDKKKVVEYEEHFKYEGLVMMLIAALTEALIFFIVKNIKTDNYWNHLFISYSLGAVLLTIYEIKKFNFDIEFNKIIPYSKITLSLIINIFIGLFGNILKFLAMYKLPAIIYSPLSYFGIITASIYGVLLNNESISINSIIGTLFVIISNLYLFRSNV
jgi:drug/metabolite transporter (DMT)-like permease